MEGLALQTLGVVCCVLLDLYFCGSLSAIMSHNVMFTVNITPTDLSFSLGMFFFFHSYIYLLKLNRNAVLSNTRPPLRLFPRLFFSSNSFLPLCHASLASQLALFPHAPFHWTSGQTVTPSQSDIKSLPINGHQPSDPLLAPLLLLCPVTSLAACNALLFQLHIASGILQ